MRTLHDAKLLLPRRHAPHTIQLSMVARPGLEPIMRESESPVLPITPSGNDGELKRLTHACSMSVSCIPEIRQQSIRVNGKVVRCASPTRFTALSFCLEPEAMTPYTPIETHGCSRAGYNLPVALIPDGKSSCERRVTQVSAAKWFTPNTNRKIHYRLV